MCMWYKCNSIDWREYSTWDGKESKEVSEFCDLECKKNIKEERRNAEKSNNQ